MPSKNKTLYWIGQKGYTKFAETGPEMVVKEILEQIQLREGFTFKHGTEAFALSVVCKSDDGLEFFEFHPDFIVEMKLGMTNGQLKKIIEVDGVYHFTKYQEKKRRWRDSLLLKQGFDIIHIDARYPMFKGYRATLQAQLRKKLREGSPVEFLDA